jgi:hypothetical protein
MAAVSRLLFARAALPGLLVLACAELAGVEDGEPAPDGGTSGAGAGASAGASGGGSSGSAGGSATGGEGGSAGSAAGAGGTPGTGGLAGAGTGGAGAGGAGTGGAGTGGASTGSQYADAVLADQPLAYWRFSETSGTTAADASGNGHHGVIKGTTKLGEPGALKTDSDTAFYFDGASSTFVDLGDKFDFEGTAPFTLEAWIYPQVADRGFLGKATYDGVLKQYLGYFVAEGAGVVQFVRDGAGATVPELSQIQYTHLVATFDGINWTIYLNGAKGTAKPGTNAVTKHPLPFTIGKVNEWNTMIGWIDEVAVYDKALDATRVKAHYDAGVGP